MSETPLYDATLSATLARLRAEASAHAAAELQGQIAEARQLAALARQEAEQARAELALARREAGVRSALREAEVEELVRTEIVHAAAPLVELAPEAPTGRPDPDAEDGGPVAPHVPSFEELRTPSHRVDAFFDALLGP